MSKFIQTWKRQQTVLQNLFNALSWFSSSVQCGRYLDSIFSYEKEQEIDDENDFPLPEENYQSRPC